MEGCERRKEKDQRADQQAYDQSMGFPAAAEAGDQAGERFHQKGDKADRQASANGFSNRDHPRTQTEGNHGTSEEENGQ